MDPKQAHVEQLSSGRWAIFNPDCSRFDGKTFASKSAARRELIFLRAGRYSPKNYATNGKKRMSHNPVNTTPI